MDYEIVTSNKDTSPVSLYDIGNIMSIINIHCVCGIDMNCCPPINIGCPVVNGSCGGNGGRGGCITPNSARLI